jgi:RNA polymerase sigma-70 factor (ECF subfamily)
MAPSRPKSGSPWGFLRIGENSETRTRDQASQSFGESVVPGTRTGPFEPGASDLDRRWLRRDPDAYGDAHRCYRSRLVAVASRIVGSRADAEDVVQRVFQALPRGSYAGNASLWAYLHRAAVNGAVNLLRARRRREQLCQDFGHAAAFEAPAPANPEAQVLEGELLACVARALLHVKPRHRRVLILRIKHGLSNLEIAQQEGVPPATVATWLRRGREELRAALGPTLRELEEGA